MSLATLRERLIEHLEPAASWTADRAPARSDFDLNPGLKFDNPHALRPAAVLVAAGVALAPAPPPPRAASVALPAGTDPMAALQPIIERHCVACHAAQPTQAGFAQPPKGVMLQTREQQRQHAAKISETVASRYMPIGNLTGMTDDERAVVAAWYAALPR